MHMQGDNLSMNEVLTGISSVKRCCRLHDRV